MKKQWIGEQVACIGTKDSYFAYVPTNIGKICYCDTSSLDEDPKKKSKTFTLSIVGVIALLILLAIWSWGTFVYQILGSLVVIVFSVAIISFVFRDISDYFIGELGFCIVKWNFAKTKLKSIQTYFFSDIDLCFYGEQDLIKDGEYDNTAYSLSIYKKTDENYEKTYNYSGSYKRESKDEPDDLWAFADYNFSKNIEQIINTKYLEQNNKDFKVLKDTIKNTKLGYAVNKFLAGAGYAIQTIQSDSIINVSFDGNVLSIGDQYFDLHDYKVSIFQGWLIVNKNNSEDAIYIEVSAISHNKALLFLLANQETNA